MKMIWRFCWKMASATYSTKSARKAPKRSKSGSAAGRKEPMPQWFIFTVVVSITFMLCLAINFRAFSETRKQTAEFTELNSEIDKLTTNNVVLQQDIQDLKSDDETIAREARKIGMSRSNEKVLVPTN